MTAHAWIMSSGERRTLPADIPLDCGGDSDWPCPLPVAWVATTLCNSSGLPGLAEEMCTLTCERHLNKVCAALAVSAVSGVTLTPYTP